MGGIKNREAKKKANNVFSGGGGGGTKGPSTIDKRKLEHPCPFCERIFQQKDRLAAHVSKQHAEDAAAAADADAEAGLGKEPPADAAGAGAASSSSADTMMRPGAKAGYYTSKSPQLLLQDQCRTDGRVKPRIKTQEKEGGLWGCKAVIPRDPKKLKEQDIVHFLPDELHATSEDEAKELGSLAMLQHIAGHRSLDRILPKQYVPVWHRLNEIAAEKKEKEMTREQRAAASKAREAREQKKELKEQLTSSVVSMSTDKIDLVQRLIAQPLRDLEQRNGTTNSGGGVDALADGVEAKLGKMGVHAQHVKLAAAHVATGATLEDVLDWLCVNVPAIELPRALRGRSWGGVSVAHAASAAPTSAQSGGAQDFAATAHLLRFGFSPTDAAAALAQCDGNAGAAWAQLFAALTNTAALAPPPSWGTLQQAVSKLALSDADTQYISTAPRGEDDEAAIEEGADAWQDELTVLQSMYGSAELLCACSGFAVLQLPLPSALFAQYNRGAAPGEEIPPVQIMVMNCVAAGYPEVLPLFGIHCAGLPGAVRAAFTAMAAQHLQHTSVGGPVLHELFEHLHSALDAAEAPLLSAAQLRYGKLLFDSAPEATADDAPSPVMSDSKARRGRKHRVPRHEITRSADQLQAESVRLQAMLQRNSSDGGKAAQMRSAREKLPAFKERRAVLSAINTQRVVVIAGATGCGKSTQVPQFVLEQQIERGDGAAANIVVTQPRRLPAVSLAERVSDEMCQECGGVVGYSVRLNKKTSRDTRLTFCTTGILLRRLVDDAALSRVTHVIVDEVHERSLESDLLLLLLKDTLALNPRLRIVLMSATANPEEFVRYYEGALAAAAAGASQAAGSDDVATDWDASDPTKVAVVDIPGFTYPVRELALEDVVEATGPGPLKGGKAVRKPGLSPDKLTSLAAKHKEACAGYRSYAGATFDAIAAIDESALNYDLLEAAVVHVVAAEAAGGADALLRNWPGVDDYPPSTRPALAGPGAILVFLPGAPEIGRMQRQLESSGALRSALSGDRAEVLPLHGSLPPAAQAAVFKHYGAGHRKIVLATNVAETSVTIADVTIVIDTGRMKEMQFDSGGGIARLADAWVSRAAARQRRGRAGRVRPGVCLRLFSRVQWNALAEHQLPEMLRSPLEPLCLQIKAVLPQRGVAQVLAAALTPPAPDVVAGALQLLRTRQLLDPQEALTPLGQHLTHLPLDPAIGKMLVYAAMLQCTDPVLTIAAALGHGRPVFMSPPQAREEAAAARAKILENAGGTRNLAAKSDHVATVFAFNEFRRVKRSEGYSAARRWCGDSFVSFEAMDAIHSGRVDYANCLAELGFVNEGYVRRTRSGDDVSYTEAQDANAADARLVKAAVCAGFYPQVLRVDNPMPTFSKVSGGAFESDSKGVPKIFHQQQGRVLCHPTSINTTANKFETGWLVYTDMVQTSKVFVRASSMAPMYSLLLFGGQPQVKHEAGTITVDDWVVLRAPSKVGVLVRELRKLLDDLLRAKLEDPSKDLSREPVLQGILELLRTDGL